VFCVLTAAATPANIAPQAVRNTTASPHLIGFHYSLSMCSDWPLDKQRFLMGKDFLGGGAAATGLRNVMYEEVYQLSIN
jgi:hypothetical protein